MGINQLYPTLDGIAPSWADIAVTVVGRTSLIHGPVALLTMDDIAAINTGTTVEVGYMSGASGGRRRKRTTGAVSDEASFTLYRSGYQKLIRGLAAVAPKRGNQALISLVHFDVLMLHTPPGDIDIYDTRIKGCRVLGRQLNSAEGTDAQQVEVPLSPMQIVDMINGVEVVML